MAAIGSPRREPGEIVWAGVLDVDANRGRLCPKKRPAVIIGRVGVRRGGGWQLMGLTTLDRHADGNPRTPYPPQRGLTRAGYLWGYRTVMVPGHDITGHIGWADDAMIDAIRDLAGLSDWEVEPMRPHARRDRRRSKSIASTRETA